MKERVQHVLVATSLCLLTLGCDRDGSVQHESIPREEMQFVAGASYRMGSDVDELERIRAATGLRTTGPLMAEVSARNVVVADFYIDTLDVTNRQFLQFVEAVPAWSKSQLAPGQHNGRYLEHWAQEGPPDRQLDHPVTFVTWQSAVAYCEWQGKRLPTEIEYEWAAQDDSNSIEYPWGNNPPNNDIVNWGGNSIRSTVPVGSYPPNARGLFDMAGNVWHFTADPWLGSYDETASKLADRKDYETNPQMRRVVRGGSWGANAANLRVRYRDSHRSFDAREMVGFRCAKSAAEL